MDGILLWKQDVFPVFCIYSILSACKSTILNLQGRATLVVRALLIVVVPLNATHAETSFSANFGPGSIDGYGVTPEAACHDLITKTTALEGGGGILESVITAPAGISDACGDPIVSGMACKFYTGLPGSADYCTFYAFLLPFESTSSIYMIRIEPEGEPPESDTALMSVEPGKSTTSLIARVYNKNGDLVPSVDIQLEAGVLANTGGHQHHDNSRPKGSLGGTDSHPYIITGNTKFDGFRFRFNAPVISGDHDISASCVVESCTQEGPDEIWVGVKGLVKLDSGPHHVLIGETSSHFDNHYLRHEARADLLELAYYYKMIWSPFNPLLHINDASLERGGLFDIGEKWISPHVEHKRGTVVDIRANHAPGAIPEEDYESFELLAEEMYMSARLERKKDDYNNELTSQRHYHVRIFGRGE